MKESPVSDEFYSTRWSTVERAGNQCESALENLCACYWYPLYAYASRRMGREAAQDATQAFFAVLLEKNYVESADQAKGKFRAFLLTAFKRFLANQYDRQQAIKRGGGLKHFTLDFVQAGSNASFQPEDDLTPEKVFERQWVLTLLENVMARMADHYRNKGEESLMRFAALKQHMLGEVVADYSAIGEDLGVSAEFLRVQVHRMRKKYQEMLRCEIAGTIGGEEDVDEEIKRLFETLG
jgi:RNA polymerase sigma-70 factor (ECF subfamily)